MRIYCAPHPELELQAFTAAFPCPLGEMSAPSWLTDLLSPEAPSPISRPDDLRAAIRDLLRHGGYKPTGRGKPASEYLVGAAERGKLSTINLAVDANNVASLHSGLPISVLDIDRLVGTLGVAIAKPETRYVFNHAGQEIDVSGLLCAHDDAGPCGNAVKDSQRTKTSSTTTQTVSLIWGSKSHTDHVTATVTWYRELLARAGAATAACEVT